MGMFKGEGGNNTKKLNKKPTQLEVYFDIVLMAYYLSEEGI